MAWETPAFEEIEMNAEVGSYQGDYDDRDYNGL
jgi:coenzyme PQQ precursor peptide PqqA